jgi:hypothetical protein
MIASKLLSKLQLFRYTFLNHPGFTSQAERMALYNYLKKQKRWLKDNALSCLEFGPFLGSATVAMAESLRDTQVPIIALDAFCFKKCTAFAEYVEKILNQNGISKSDLVEDGNFLRFDAIFDRLCKTYSSVSAYRVEIHDNSVIDLPLNGKKCGFAHIDLPKTMDLGKPIFISLANSLEQGSTIVLQDFAYRWSNELIIFAMSLLSNGAKCVQMVGPSLYLQLDSPANTIYSSISSYDKIIADSDKQSIEKLLLNALALTERHGDHIRYNEILLSSLVVYKSLGLSNKFKESLKYKINTRTYASLAKGFEDLFLHGGVMERSFL